MQAEKKNPADRWGDGGIQANQTEDREGGQSEREARMELNIDREKTAPRKEK